jgi:hypothetical protein
MTRLVRVVESVALNGRYIAQPTFLHPSLLYLILLLPFSYSQWLFAVCFSWQLLITLFLAHRFSPPWWWKQYIPPKRQFLREPHCVTSQTTAFLNLLHYLCQFSLPLQWICESPRRTEEMKHAYVHMVHGPNHTYLLLNIFLSNQ